MTQVFVVPSLGAVESDPDDARYERRALRGERLVQIGALIATVPLLVVLWPWHCIGVGLVLLGFYLPVLWRRSQPAAVVAAVSVGLVLAVALGASVGVAEVRMVAG